MISQWIHRISDTQRPYRKWKIPSGNSKLRDQESFCKEDQRVVFGCLKKRWKDTGGILQCIYQKGFQKDRIDFWRLSLEHDQYKDTAVAKENFIKYGIACYKKFSKVVIGE